MRPSPPAAHGFACRTSHRLEIDGGNCLNLEGGDRVEKTPLRSAARHPGGCRATPRHSDCSRTAAAGHPCGRRRTPAPCTRPFLISQHVAQRAGGATTPTGVGGTRGGVVSQDRRLGQPNSGCCMRRRLSRRAAHEAVRATSQRATGVVIAWRAGSSLRVAGPGGGPASYEA